MLKYVILGNACGIGGWQLYISARFQYLNERGINTYVLYDKGKTNDNVSIYNLKTSDRCLGLNGLGRRVYLYPEREWKQVVCLVKQLINYSEDDKIVIESTSISHSLWGESLADSLKGIHYCYLLHSYFDKLPESYLDFFKFKYHQGLIAGIKKDSMQELFNTYTSVDMSENFYISATWPEPICENRPDCQKYIDFIETSFNNGCIIIGYFGTLEKKHFPLVCSIIADYVNTHKECNFLFISIGSSTDGNAEVYQNEAFGTIDNCISYNVPGMYPVPKQLFELMHVCLASFGSAVSAAHICQRVILLADDRAVIPRGIIGVTLKTPPYFNSKAKVDNLFELLDNVVFNNKFNDIQYEIPPANNWELEHKRSYERILSFTNKRLFYYNVRKFKKLSIKERFSIIFCRVCGTNNLSRLANFFK